MLAEWLEFAKAAATGIAAAVPIFGALARLLCCAAVWLALAVTPALAQQPPIGVESLRELYMLIVERDRQVTQRFEALQKAIDTASAAQDKVTSVAFAAAKEAVAAALASQEKATAAAFAAANEAVKTAQQANEKRLDSVNEFRGQLKDQTATLVTRTEVAVQFKAMADKVEEMTRALTEIRARGEGAATLWTASIAVVGLVIGGITVTLLMLRRPRPVKDELAA
jgi:hypothetical protein